MGLGGLIDRLWRRPPTREARNEQKKALANALNAIAIAMGIAGFVGPAINPVLTETLAPLDRVLLICGAAIVHALVRAILWALEDK